MTNVPPGSAKHAVLCATLTLHVALLAWSSWYHSPVGDEVGHLTAGLSHWRFQNYELFAVNPPLIRLVATTPLLFGRFEEHWDGYTSEIRLRPEFSVGRRFVKENDSKFRFVFTVARWACIPFSVLAALVCYRWATRLYGARSGFCALAMYCGAPTILGHASLITPDAGSACLGLLACYMFWDWTQSPTLPRAIAVGAVLGCAVSAKFTLLLLYVVITGAAVLYICRRRATGDARRECATVAMHVMLMYAISLYVVNMLFFYEGSFTRLRDFQFSSQALAGERPVGVHYGNRFIDTPIGTLPVPLPKYYLLGIDQVKYEYELTYWSYLRGDHRRGGWWYYYIYAACVKMPVGFIVLIACGVTKAIGLLARSSRTHSQFLVLAPPLAIFSVVSSQTGFNHHFRYVLPALPFLFIAASSVFCGAYSRWRVAAVLYRVCLVCGLIGSLAQYPHSLSFFNLFVGSENGWRHLDFSNLDWGQDIFALKDWVDARTSQVALAGKVSGMLPPESFGLALAEPKVVYHDTHANGTAFWPEGWYVFSYQELLKHNSPYACFLDMRPFCRINYSVAIYRLTRPCRATQRTHLGTGRENGVTERTEAGNRYDTRHGDVWGAR